MTPARESFIRYERDAADPYRLRTNKVRCLYEDSRGNIWVGSADDGLHRFDPDSGRFYHYPSNNSSGTGPSQPLLKEKPNLQTAVTFIREDQAGYLWIGALSGGVNRYDPRTGEQLHFEPDPTDPYSLSSDKTWSFLQSADGVIWIAASIANHQIDYLPPDEFHLRKYSLPDLTTVSLGSFSCLLKDQRGHYWLGGLDTLYHFAPDWRLLETFQHEPGTAHSMTPETINTLFEDSQGRIWIGKTTGVNRYDPGKKEMIHFQYDPKDPYSLIDDDVIGIRENPQGHIWIGTTGGLCRFNPEKMNFTHLRTRPGQPNALNTNFLLSMASGPEPYLWLGTALGLSRLNTGTGKVDNLEIGFVGGILPRSDGKVWVGCYPGRLILFDPEKWSIEEDYTEADGLPGTDVFGILQGPEGALWLGTTDAIVRFDPQRSSFESLFPPTQFLKRIRPLLVEDNGWAYFSVGRSLVVFHTDSIDMTPRNPRVRLTDIRFHYHNREKAATSGSDPPAFLVDALKLNHRQNDFSIFYSAMQFHQPQRIRYQYKLQGYDTDWRTGPVNHIAGYTNLDPGYYEFQVKATDAYGNWSDRITRLPIAIAPPWWRTWWAILLFVVTGTGLIAAFFYDQYRHQMRKAEARRLQELDTVKNRLYTNISHEFRTPLTIISGMAEQVLEQPEKWFRSGLQLIRDNSKKVLYLVNQMLALRKLETGNMPVRLEQGDILPYLRYLTHSFHSYAQVRGVQLHFLPGQEEIYMDYDPEKLMNILSNLLSNAIKFTPAGGNIYVRVEVEPASPASRQESGAEKVLLLQVRDTGIGIPKEELPYIFDRYHQVRELGDGKKHPESSGTGIGLAIIRELVKLMKGDLEVKSRQGKETEFSIRLPVMHNAPPAPASSPADVATRAGEYAPVLSASTAAVLSEDSPEPTSEQPLALLTEDQPDFRAFLQMSLAGQYRTEVAGDGEEGLQKAFALVPDIVITDLIMPRMDGAEFCERLKADERTSHVPVILLTSQTDRAARIAGLKRGADDYLTKPFHQEELLVRMRNLLELRQSLRTHFLATAGLSQAKTEKAPSTEETRPKREDVFVKKARDIVLEHLDDFDFKVQDFCRALNMSHSQLHRKLTALTGLSAGKFIRAIRLKQAEELLADPERSITAIALDTGFNDPDYFSRVFRQEFGISPTDYRKELTKED